MAHARDGNMANHTNNARSVHAPALRLGVLSLVLLMSAAAIALGPLSTGRELPGAPLILSWWVLVLLFALGELLEVPLESRGEAHSLTFIELAYVIGLAFATPGELVVGRVLGGVIVLVFVRHQSLPKLVTNLSIFAAEAAVATLVFRAVLGDASPPELQGWLAFILAMLSAHAVGVSGVTAGITITSGWPGRAVLHQVIIFGGIVNVANTLAGLAFVSSIWEESNVGVLLVGLALVLFFLYRAYTRLGERHKNLETLHDFTRGLGGSLEMEELEQAVLQGAQTILRGEHGALLLPPVRAGAPATRLVSSGDELRRSSISVIELEADLTILLPDGTSRLFEPGQPLPGWLAEIGIKDGAIVPLLNDGTVSGAMIVANRLTEVSSFVEDDLRVFETLASHASVALENGRLVAHLQHEAREKAYQALHDPVTDLPNRTSLHDQLEEAIRQAKASELSVGLVFVDLDTFKEVTDTLGTATSDRLLVEVRDRLETLLPDTATLARFTGDQFAVLMRRVVHEDEVMGLAESIHAEFDSPFTAEGVSLVLGASIGVALYPAHAPSADLLQQRADAATYTARVARSGIEMYVAETDPYAPRRLALAAELREALEQDEVDVYLQPKVSLADGHVVGAEALVRWTHPRLGPLSPDQFIPAAEHTGVIRYLTLYVVRGALAQCRRWRDDGIDLTISVNLSARNLFDSHLVEDIGEAMRTAGVPRGVLTLELTESTVMSGSRRSMAVLEGLRDLGVGLSVDDFGTGYSSISHLRQLPVTELKIDKSFVGQMTVNEHDAVIVRTLIELGARMGLDTVAEGVESTEAFDLLKEYGCDQAQGYLLSRPLPIAQFEAWLARQQVQRIDRGEAVVPFLRERRAASSDDG